MATSSFLGTLVEKEQMRNIPDYPTDNSNDEIMAHHLRGLLTSTKSDFTREELGINLEAVPKSYSYSTVETRVLCGTISMGIHQGNRMQTYSFKTLYKIDTVHR